MTATEPGRAAPAHGPKRGAAGTEDQEGLRRVATLVITLGFGVRLLEYFSRPPFWIDEARVALNIGRRSWLDLAQPLDHDQAAPVPFLWSIRLAAKLVGMNEYGLRLLPLLAGLALLPVLWHLGRRWLGDRVALVALGLAAASPFLIRYANEVKQYSLDALAAVVAFVLTVRLLERPDSTKAWRWLALGGAGLVVVSHPIPFVLAGCGLALLASAVARATPRFRTRWLAVVVLWLTVFFVLYVTGYRSATKNPYMQAFWSGTYLDPTATDFGERLARAASGVMPLVLAGRGEGVMIPILAAGFLLGLMVLAHRRKLTALVMLAGPLVALGLASGLRLYPVAERLTLFLIPVVCLVLGIAADGVVRRTGRAGGFVVPAILLVCGIQGALVAKETLRAGDRWSSRDLIRHYESSAGTEPVYVYAGGIPAWTFYTTDWSAPDRQRLARIGRLVAADGPAFTNRPARGRRVQCEGDSLVMSYRGRQELFGLGAGVGFVMPFRRWPPKADSGWAENEVRRMQETGRERVWLLGIYIQDPWLRELLEAAKTVGAVAETTLVAGRGVRHRGVLVPLRFSSSPPSRVRGSGCPTSTPRRDVEDQVKR